MPTALMENVSEIGGAAVGGFGSEFLQNKIVVAKGSVTRSTVLTTMLADLAIGAISGLGVSQLRGSGANIAQGILMGAAGHFGTLLGRLAWSPAWKYAMFPPSIPSGGGTAPGGGETVPPTGEYRVGSYAASVPTLSI